MMTVSIDQKPSGTQMRYPGIIRDGKKDILFTVIQNDYGIMGKNTVIEFYNATDPKNREYHEFITAYINTYDIW